MSSGYNPERALHAFFAQQQVPQATQQQQDWWWKHQNDTNLIQLNTLRKNAHKFPQQLSPRSKHLAPLAKSPRSPRSPRVPHSTLPIPGLVLVPPGSPRGPRPDYQPPSFRMATPSQRNKPNVGALPPIQADADAVAEEDDGLTEEGRKILAEAKAAEEAKKKKEMQYLISQVEENIYKRNVGGGDMFRQFQKMDLDRSGRLNRAEIKHALNVSFNMLVDDEKLDLLMANLDLDGDGGVSYEEFTDKLVRETVAPAAMGKRGLQSKEAMGVDAQAWLNKQLGHGAAPKNEKFKGDKELQGVGVEIEGITAKSVREAHTAIVRKLLDKFGSARKIFLTVDEDRDVSDQPPSRYPATLLLSALAFFAPLIAPSSFLTLLRAELYLQRGVHNVLTESQLLSRNWGVQRRRRHATHRRQPGSTVRLS